MGKHIRHTELWSIDMCWVYKVLMAWWHWIWICVRLMLMTFGRDLFVVEWHLSSMNLFSVGCCGTEHDLLSISYFGGVCDLFLHWLLQHRGWFVLHQMLWHCAWFVFPLVVLTPWLICFHSVALASSMIWFSSVGH